MENDVAFYSVKCVGCGFAQEVLADRVGAAKEEHVLYHRNELGDRTSIDFQTTPVISDVQSGPISS